MSWQGKPSPKDLALFLMFIHLASRPSFSCITTNMTVPKPDVKYMLDMNLHVSWSDELAMGNYSLNYCCKKEVKQNLGTCTNQCPNYAEVQDCQVVPNTLPVKYHCTILSTQYIIYIVYLSAEFQGCKIRSENVEIIPRLHIVHAPGVKHLNMISHSNGLVVQWPESHPGSGVCYFVTCREMEGPNKGKQVFHSPHHKELTVSIPLKDVSDAFTSYECCVKAHLCDPDLGHYSEEVCNQSKTLPTAPSEAPTMLCGINGKKSCPLVVENNLRNVTLLWKLPDKSKWNGIPKGIKLVVVKIGENTTTNLFVKGMATEYTLTGLSTDVDYEVSLSMCNQVDCGAITILMLSALQTKTGGASSFFSPKIMAIIVSSVLFIVALTLIACSVLDSRRTTERVSSWLPALHEPVTIPDQACSGDSVATSIFVNPADYDVLHREPTERFKDYESDTSSQRVNGNGCDTSSVDSYEAEPSRPLLAKGSERTALAGKQRVMVTYLPQQPGNVSALKANLSDDECPKFV